MENSELLPCPFCGNTPKIESSINNGFYLVCCFGCFHDEPGGYDGCPETRNTLEDVTKLWNTRIQPRVIMDAASLPDWKKILKPEYVYLGEVFTARISIAETLACINLQSRVTVEEVADIILNAGLCQPTEENEYVVFDSKIAAQALKAAHPHLFKE